MTSLSQINSHRLVYDSYHLYLKIEILWISLIETKSNPNRLTLPSHMLNLTENTLVAIGKHFLNKNNKVVLTVSLKLYWYCMYKCTFDVFNI